MLYDQMIDNAQIIDDTPMINDAPMIDYTPLLLRGVYDDAKLTVDQKRN